MHDPIATSTCPASLALARLALTLGLAALATAAQASTPTIVDEWASIKAPAAPALKSATLDPKTTALRVLDFVNPNCTSPPRCMATLPAMKTLLAEARGEGMRLVFATGPTGRRAGMLPDVAPLESETIVSTGVDRFVNTELEKVLKTAGRQTVIATGTSAHGGDGAPGRRNSMTAGQPGRSVLARASVLVPAKRLQAQATSLAR